MKNALFFILLVVIVNNIIAVEVSGKIVNGLRILTPEEVSAKVITLYRGDYVVFPTKKSESKTLVVDGLKIKQVFPAEEGKKNYVKFKKTGLYEFKYDDIKGNINVIEYTQANYKAVNAKEAKEIIANISPLILDVRTMGEYNRGFIEGSKLLPVQNIQREFTKLLDYKDKPILIYCATGNRSTVAARILIQNGFKNIYNMRYGIAEWARSGYPVKKNSGIKSK
ncbi:MAG: hypothetical protein GQ534_03160 [Candidatus Delongbacteria bacterium]|nr:hypothetical protein [Candidatus Delongbacteria bacterium]